MPYRPAIAAPPTRGSGSQPDRAPARSSGFLIAVVPGRAPERVSKKVGLALRAGLGFTGIGQTPKCGSESRPHLQPGFLNTL
jgi:hypothetical protein